MDSGANSNVNIGSYANPYSNADARTDPHANPGSYTYTYTYTYTYANPDAYANANPHSRSYGHGNADACTYANADTVSTPVIGGVEGLAGSDRKTREADLLNYVFF